MLLGARLAASTRIAISSGRSVVPLLHSVARRAAATGDGTSRGPAAPRSAMEGLVAQMAPSGGVASTSGSNNPSGSSDSSGAPAAGTEAKKSEQQEAVARAQAPFLAKIDQLASQAEKHKSRREKWKAKKQEAKKKERSTKLVYRYVGDELDRIQLKRDLLHWFKFFRFGREFVVDEALERLCRYFNREAQAELRSSPKLFRGLPKLMAGVAFPQLRVSKMSTFAVVPKQPQSQPRSSADAEKGEKDDRDVVEGGAAAAKMKKKEQGTEGSAAVQKREFTGVKYDGPDDKKVLLAPSSFRKPTMVIYANMGGFLSGPGKESEIDMWKALVRDPGVFRTSEMIDVVSGTTRDAGNASGSSSTNNSSSSAGTPTTKNAAPAAGGGAAATLSTRRVKPPRAIADAGPTVDDVVPSFSLYNRSSATTAPPAATAKGRPTSDGSGASAAGGGTTTPPAPVVNPNQRIPPPMARFLGQSIDVITIRTIDVYVAKSIRHVSNLRVRDFVSRLPPEELERTYIGTDLTRALEPLGLQNHLAVYCFLVDHKGRIRWMSSGQPDQREVDVFPELLQQLDYEFMKATTR